MPACVHGCSAPVLTSADPREERETGESIVAEGPAAVRRNAKLHSEFACVFESDDDVKCEADDVDVFFFGGMMYTCVAEKLTMRKNRVCGGCGGKFFGVYL